ncbi:MAG TPA: VCBS repeat-containing protein [Sandaracinaceae bacterium LLY-WYZ-13_1]|nr:VCBS repeat-containing protein [Sandaracinaceae bacterium LLY-WYZ-13_1]
MSKGSNGTKARVGALSALIALSGAVLVHGCDDDEADAPAAAEDTPAEGEPSGDDVEDEGAQADDAEDEAPTASAEVPDDLPNGLLLAYSQFPTGPDGSITPTPGAALVEILTRRGGEWHVDTIEDEASNVFHKAMVYDPPGDTPPGILTIGAMGAAVKLWHPDGDGWTARTLWEAEFGGRFDRMRDVEVADLYGDQRPALAVATHDQGVVATVRPPAEGDEYRVTELDRTPDTFIHEIEIGDLDGDGTPEVYATPSEPNDLDGGEQHGTVVRFVPGAEGEAGPTVVADLGNRHAKEIWVGDVDGDGSDELYVAVEALTEGRDPNVRIVEPVEIRRYEADTPPDQGVVIATLPDRLCRFLTVGDVDGDGDREMVAAAFSSGVWMLRPGRDPNGEWTKERVDPDSAGFEHAALMADLDDDGSDELYVAADEQGELRRYVWVNGRPRREVIHEREVPRARMTWNLMPVPRSVLGD